MCLFCFSDEPLRDDEKKGRQGQVLGQLEGTDTYDLTLCQVPCCTPACPCCLGTMLCFPCAQIWMRHRALNHVEPGSGWKNYTCCQGYYGGCCCLQPGKCGDKQCPCPCMCLETCCCPGLAVSATSMIIREHYHLGLDRDDIRLIRCTNCLQILACVCYILACVTGNDAVDCAAQVIGWIADAVFCSVAGCMTAQCHHEILLREEQAQAPQAETMEGRGEEPENKAETGLENKE